MRVGRSKQKAGPEAAATFDGERTNGTNGHAAQSSAAEKGGGVGAAGNHSPQRHEEPSHRHQEHIRAGNHDSRRDVSRVNSTISKASHLSATSNTSRDEDGVPRRRKNSFSKSYVKQVTRQNSAQSRSSRHSARSTHSRPTSGDRAPDNSTDVSGTDLEKDNGVPSIEERMSQEGGDEAFHLKDLPPKKEAVTVDAAHPHHDPHLNRVPSKIVPFVPQAAGHDEALKSWDDHPGMILKKSSDIEHEALEKLMGTSLKKYCPCYYGRETIDDEMFLVMQNCLYELERPHVMDIKMGQRTFQETEVSNSKRRMDLLQKMIKVDPNEATDEEQEKGITKLRYMQFREKMSTSLSLGFRIDAIHLPDDGQGTLSRDDARKLHSKEQVEASLANFLDDHAVVHAAILARLKELRAALEDSAWFREHELVGSSLLFAFDAANPSSSAGVWMIDFAHANPVSNRLSHREEWQPGNHEDGYLIGLDRLIEMWDKSLGSKVSDVVVDSLD